LRLRRSSHVCSFLPPLLPFAPAFFLFLKKDGRLLNRRRDFPLLSWWPARSGVCSPLFRFGYSTGSFLFFGGGLGGLAFFCRAEQGSPFFLLTRTVSRSAPSLSAPFPFPQLENPCSFFNDIPTFPCALSSVPVRDVNLSCPAVSSPPLRIARPILLIPLLFRVTVEIFPLPHLEDLL